MYLRAALPEIMDVVLDQKCDWETAVKIKTLLGSKRDLKTTGIAKKSIALQTHLDKIFVERSRRETLGPKNGRWKKPPRDRESQNLKVPGTMKDWT